MPSPHIRQCFLSSFINNILFASLSTPYISIITPFSTFSNHKEGLRIKQ
jgi:hypothetical protein